MNYFDQTAFFDPAKWAWPVHLIGAGGINNLVGPMLAKMGIDQIHIWDDDFLEERNCPTEVAYSYKMVGRPKVTAMADAIYYLMPNGVEVYQHQTRVTEQTKLEGVVIAGVDSMASRKTIWQAVKQNSVEIPLFIDGRSAGEETALFAFSPLDFENVGFYEDSWLFDDDEASPLPCGARNIGYISAYMAFEICRVITRFYRELPIEFYTWHDFS